MKSEVCNLKLESEIAYDDEVLRLSLFAYPFKDKVYNSWNLLKGNLQNYCEEVVGKKICVKKNWC